MDKGIAKPQLSVILSVYNGADYLRAAVDSILSQTFRNFELILINDGSTDSSKEIIESYDDPRIRLINQENHGLVFSLNRGFSLAAGEYIARMDADDISSPSRLEKQMEVISSKPEVAVVGSFFSYIDEEDNHLDTVMASPTKDIDIKRSLYVANPLAHGSTLIRKSVWKAVGGYIDTYKSTEDFELWRKIADLPKTKFAIVPEVLYWYRINPNGISKRGEEIQQKNAEKIIQEQWKKPYFKKSMRNIIRDGKFYKSLRPKLYGDIVFNAYCYQQLVIMQQLFKDEHFLTGLQHAAALARLKPTYNMVLLVRAILGGLMRKMGVKR